MPHRCVMNCVLPPGIKYVPLVRFPRNKAESMKWIEALPCNREEILEKSLRIDIFICKNHFDDNTRWVKRSSFFRPLDPPRFFPDFSTPNAQEEREEKRIAASKENLRNWGRMKRSKKNKIKVTNPECRRSSGLEDDIECIILDSEVDSTLCKPSSCHKDALPVTISHPQQTTRDCFGNFSKTLAPYSHSSDSTKFGDTKIRPALLLPPTSEIVKSAYSKLENSHKSSKGTNHSLCMSTKPIETTYSNTESSWKTSKVPKHPLSLSNTPIEILNCSRSSFVDANSTSNRATSPIFVDVNLTDDFIKTEPFEESEDLTEKALNVLDRECAESYFPPGIIFRSKLVPSVSLLNLGENDAFK